MEHVLDVGQHIHNTVHQRLTFSVSFQAVYFYDSDGRGPCLAIDGDKQALCSYKNYLVTIKQNRYVHLTSNV